MNSKDINTVKEFNHKQQWMPYYYHRENISIVNGIPDYQLTTVYCHGCGKVEKLKRLNSA